MKINKLLKTCLQRNKRLVIPTLGAFIRKKVDGVGEVLVFVPFLNKDDGVLCQAIKSWAGVEQEDAEQILLEYVATIKELLKEKNQYIIESIGVLKYDTNGIIYLTKEEPVEQVEVKAIPEPIVEPKVEPIPQVVVEKIVPPVVLEPVAVAPRVAVAPQYAAEEQREPFRANQYQTPASSVDYDTQYKAPVNNNNYESQFQAPISNFNYEKQYQDNGDSSYNQREETLVKPTSDYTPKSPGGAVSYYDKKPANDTRESSNSQSVRANNQEPAGRYFSSPQAPPAPPKPRYSNIYGDSSSSTKSEVPNPKREQVNPPQRRIGDVKRSSRKSQAAPSNKNKDVVLWIAIAAVVMTVIILIYGYTYGGEHVLNSEALIENISNSGNAVEQQQESISQ